MQCLICTEPLVLSPYPYIFKHISGGGVPSTGCTVWTENCAGPGGLHQQEGGQTDCYDCGVWGHTLRRTPPDREKTEGD